MLSNEEWFINFIRQYFTNQYINYCKVYKRDYNNNLEIIIKNIFTDIFVEVYDRLISYIRNNDMLTSEEIYNFLNGEHIRISNLLINNIKYKKIDYKNFKKIIITIGLLKDNSSYKMSYFLANLIENNIIYYFKEKDILLYDIV